MQKYTDNYNIVIVISGGLDSTTLLYKLVKDIGYKPARIFPITFHYGQIAKKESEYAELHCKELGTADIKYIDVSQIKSIFQSSLMNDGLFGKPSELSTTNKIDVESTVVPNRNGMFLTIASILAAKAGKRGIIYYGAHQSDYDVYPDCRPEFVKGFNKYVKLALGYDYDIRVSAPFTTKRKWQVVRIGHELGVDFTRTWSCYENGRLHCGKCQSCYERRKAFTLAQVSDSTLYAN